MADNTTITPGSGVTIACDEVTDGVLGSAIKVQFTKLMDGTLDSTNKLIVDSSGRAATLASFAGNSFAKVKATTGAPAAVSIKGSAGTLYGWNLYCNKATPVYIKFYNVASGSVTVGSTTPSFTVAVPPGAVSNASLSATFGTAMSYALTGGIAESDTTTLSTDDLVGTITYA